ncbi:MAG: helix-turn-helix domain-containing protein [Candidatus Hydrothermarchaeales archaeon]
MNIEETLKNSFKLSLYEVRVYLALLRGSMAPKEAATASKVPLSRVYDTLKSLESKGFVGYNNDKYEAVSPEIALDGRIAQFEAEFEVSAKERKGNKKLVLEHLNSMYLRESPAQELVTLKGIYSITNKFLEILNESEEVYITIRKALEAKDLLKKYLVNSQANNRKIRILIPGGAEINDTDREFASRIGLKMRYYDNLLFDLMVADGRDVIIGVPDPTSNELYHSIAIWIRNPSFAKGIQESLENVWENESYTG